MVVPNERCMLWCLTFLHCFASRDRLNQLALWEICKSRKAAAVVKRMKLKKEPPKLNQGFSKISEVQTIADTHTQTLVEPRDTLPNCCIGLNTSHAKVQQGTRKFLNIVEVPSDL
ncbi:hypothetical protein SLE2022_105530 [Rubroshorea leprosula]